MALKLMYVAKKPEVARIADKYGVDRVWIDLETLGKEERQKNMDSLKSFHTVEDIKNVRSSIYNGELMVRINPVHENTKFEIDKAVEYGADVIMLPMFRRKKEVEIFLEYVNGRAKTVLLAETKEANENIDEILSVNGIDEVHIGINDLHLSYGMKFMFETLCDGKVEHIISAAKKRNLPYGFGGVTRLGQGILPSEYVIAEHYRLESSMAILARSFCFAEKIGDIKQIDRIFEEEIAKIRNYEKKIRNESKEFFDINHQKVIDIVNKVLAEK